MAHAPKDHPAPESPAPTGAARDADGLPAGLQAAVESLAGAAMDGVRVHYASDRPGGREAPAAAQGSDIHLAPGQERHSSHEAWRVVRQGQDRAEPMPKAEGVPINDDPALEQEADRMGARAAAAAGESGD